MLSTHPSKCESILEKIPFLGSPFAWALYQDRIKPIVAYVNEQLRKREGIDIRQYWAEEDWPVASKLLQIINKTMNWEPGLFIPEDPCIIVFWAYEDCMDAVEAQELIEKEFEIKFADEVIKQINNFTLQELVDYIKKSLGRYGLQPPRSLSCQK